MPDTVIARFQSSYDVIRRVEEGRPSPLSIPYRDRTEVRYGAKGAAGYDAGIDDCDEVYDDVLNLTGTAQVLDLTALVDPDGRSVAFERVRWLRLVNLSEVEVDVAPDGTDGWAAGPTWTLPPATTDADDNLVHAGAMEITIPGATGGEVTSGSKRLTFDPGAGTAEVAVVIVGVKPTPP